MSVRFAICASVALVLSNVVPAAAQPPAAQPAQQGGQDPQMSTSDADMDEQARAHFRVGRQRYEQGRFDEAAGEFQEAYNLSRRPALLYNVFVAWRDANNPTNAAAALRQYLAEMPASDIPDRPTLEARLRALEAQIAQAEEARRQEEDARRAREEADQARTQAEAERRRAEEESRRREAAEGNTLAWIVTASGGALLIGSAVTGFLALSAVGDIEKNCPDDLCPPSYPLTDERDSARMLVTITDVLWIAGAAVAGTGLVLLALGGGGDDVEAGAEASATAMCGPDGCGASLQVRY